MEAFDSVEQSELRVIDGQLFRVVKRMNVRATAYTAGVESTGKTPEHPAYGITSTGTEVQEGRTIAVDPEVIPLNSRVYIPGRGLHVAEDTGGAIKGFRIDIYMEAVPRALSFGVRELECEVVEPVALYGEVRSIVEAVLADS
jgi:3D (Asp-Asp-Asp) domain-containing protein